MIQVKIFEEYSKRKLENGINKFFRTAGANIILKSIQYWVTTTAVPILHDSRKKIVSCYYAAVQFDDIFDLTDDERSNIKAGIEELGKEL